jgi:putative sigma-54 modulation protein
VKFQRPTNICKKHSLLNNLTVDIILQSPRIRLSNRMERVLFEKFERLEKVSDLIIRCEVVLRKEKADDDNGFIVEARLIIPGNDLFAKESGPKFEIAAENACADLERQFRKRKTKLQPKARAKAIRKKAKVDDEELE